MVIFNNNLKIFNKYGVTNMRYTNNLPSEFKSQLPCFGHFDVIVVGLLLVYAMLKTRRLILFLLGVLWHRILISSQLKGAGSPISVSLGRAQRLFF